MMRADRFEDLRRQMVAEIAAEAIYASAEIGKGALAARVIEVLGKVPRHEFVPLEVRAYAYANTPLPIGFNKTISQPFIVALMTDLLDLEATDRVLEIGTGLGYQAAILSALAGEVYSVEIVEELAEEAKKRLARQGCANVRLRTANGSRGWVEHAPYDKVIVTAAPDLIPAPLLDQLKAGGRMVIPTGLPESQRLVLAEKDAQGRVHTRELLRVRFSELEGTEA